MITVTMMLISIVHFGGQVEGGHISAETWYVLESGSDRDGCGRSVKFPCETLLYLLRQVNRTHLPPSMGIHISTDKCLSIDQKTADNLDPSVVFSKYANNSQPLIITVINVNLSWNRTFDWSFSDLNVNISHCDLGLSQLNIQPSREINPLITIRNSSFGSLNLQSGTAGIVANSHIDANFTLRPTLITANSSDVLVINSYFNQFVTLNGPTVFRGYSGCSVTIENSTFLNHRGSHGILYMHRGYSMVLKESSFLRNSLKNSPVIVLRSIQLKINRSLFVNNSAPSGGALTASYATLHIDETTFIGNRAANVGGAIYFVNNVHMNMSSCTFSGNFAQGYGGAMSGFKTATVEISNSIFTNNKALSDGGAIHVRQQSQLFLSYCQFTENNAKQHAGAIMGFLNTRIEIYTTNFTGNNASSKKGGAVNVKNRSRLIVSDCLFHRNFGTWGGAIAGWYKVKFLIEGTTFVANNVSNAGGAIFINRQGFVMLTNCIFNDNFAHEYGGAVLGSNKVILTIDTTAFIRNKALSDGGAIYATNRVKLKINYCLLSENYAGKYGGAVTGKTDTTNLYQTNYDGKYGGVTNANTGQFVNVTLMNSICIENQAGSSGGCLSVSDGANVKVMNTKFKDNEADKEGGAIYSVDATLQISNAIFKRNSAPAALAIFATNTKDAIFQNSSFYSNKSECDIVFNNCHAVSNLRMATCLMHNSCKNLTFAVRKEGKGIVSGRMWNNKFELGDRLLTNQNKHGVKYKEASMDIIESYYASVFPIRCSEDCNCYYLSEKRANILHCSNARITHLENLTIPIETQWLISDCKGDKHLSWSSNLESLEYIDLRGSDFVSISEDFFPMLQNMRNVTHINLANNHISRFPKGLQMITDQDIYLSGNPIDCNCEMLWFVEWLNRTGNCSDTRPIKDYQEMRCFGGEWHGAKVYTLNELVMGCIPSVLSKWIIGVMALIGCAILAVVLAVLMIAKRWREVKFLRYMYFGILPKDKPEDNENKMKYDAFFCYSPLDFRWIREVFMSSTIGFKRMGRKLDMEKDDGFTFHLLDRDSQVGNVTSHNVVHAIEHSKRVIIILSMNFLKYKWGMETFMMAHERVVHGRKDLLIIILKEKMNMDTLPPELRTYLRIRSYIDGTKDLNFMKKKLRFQLPHTPLKILRGDQDVEDVQDKYFAAFVPPTTTDESTNYKSDVTDHVTTDIGDVSDEGMERILGCSNTGSTENPSNDSKSSLNPSSSCSSFFEQVEEESDYDLQDTNHENTEMEMIAQVHSEQGSERDEMSEK